MMTGMLEHSGWDGVGECTEKEVGYIAIPGRLGLGVVLVYPKIATRPGTELDQDLAEECYF